MTAKILGAQLGVAGGLLGELGPAVVLLGGIAAGDLLADLRGRHVGQDAPERLVAAPLHVVVEALGVHAAEVLRGDPELPLDCVAEGCRRVDQTFVLKNAFGFGGCNTCVVFERVK